MIWRLVADGFLQFLFGERDFYFEFLLSGRSC